MFPSYFRSSNNDLHVTSVSSRVIGKAGRYSVYTISVWVLYKYRVTVPIKSENTEHFGIEKYVIAPLRNIVKGLVYQIACCQVEGRGAPNF